METKKLVLKRPRIVSRHVKTEITEPSMESSPLGLRKKTEPIQEIVI